MNESEARRILGKAIRADGSLIGAADGYAHYVPGGETVTLDSNFTADDLEAIAFWMRRPVEKI